MHRSTLSSQFDRTMTALLLLFLSCGFAQAETAVIKSASYNKKTAVLTVTTQTRGSGGLLSLIHGKGGVLGQTDQRRHRFAVPLAQLGEVPCSVEARFGNARAAKAVTGAPAECRKVPVCKILAPKHAASLGVNQPARFKAQATLRDKRASPLTYEWDFAGGVMGHPSGTLPKSGKTESEVSFVRDNSRYRVRFAATDAQGRRCEASVDVVVGQIPADLPDVTPLAQAAQQSAPALASGLQANTVVVPFEKRSMQCGHDSALLPGANLVYPPQFNTINAYVYEKALRPVLLDGDRVQLTYAAASNPADPVGGNSINATSQSWPLGVPSASASLKKGEAMERYQWPAGTALPEGYNGFSLIDAIIHYGDPHISAPAHVPDEGAYLSSAVTGTGLTPVNPDHGRYMPGIGALYAENAPQPFSEFTAQSSWFSAFWLPLTDIDDSGRVNPVSLFRVEAIDKESKTPVAATDVTLTAGKDFHCRECHALGQIGARTDIARVGADGRTDPPVLIGPRSGSVEDQEYAALHNMWKLHAFYDFNHTHHDDHLDQEISAGPEAGCVKGSMCHSGARSTLFFPDQNQTSGQYARDMGSTNASVSMHRMHGAMQYNDDRTDILRDSNGRYLCSRPDKTPCADPSKSLFPVRDAEGKILPMEQNCLRCHSGQREQCYRDRMYTAGVTCYQCHGDMLAVGQVYPKSQLHPDGNQYRLQWLDQPDCGSCHTGSGNRGQDRAEGYFSAGVKTLAFAADDPSASPNPVDPTNPDERRFAVPLAEFPVNGPVGDNDYNPILKTPLYRLGKDAHGQVACAACHGPAHGVWPNRDPNANDNVTALELQGHTGSLLDCNVCHTPDSFAKLEDNDEGIKVIDAKTGVLGGPHSLHPVNDPNWWKAAAADAGNADGTTAGGWHNDYAKRPGHAGEDQCAACHGNDHKGTRLSKTPVDRVFDYRQVSPDEWRSMQQAGFTSKLIKVAAGTPVGCDTCHSLELSCSGSPNPDCGQASQQVTGSSNQAPHLDPAVIDAVIWEDLSTNLKLVDPENDPATIDLPLSEQELTEVQGMTLDSKGALSIAGWQLQFWANVVSQQAPADQPWPLAPLDYKLRVGLHDARGAFSFQTLTIRLNCPAGQAWDQANQNCMPLAIRSRLGGGVDGGQDWTHQVIAVSGTNSPLHYALLDPPPPAMSIDAHGLITWKTAEAPVSDRYSGSLRVSDDAGNEALAPFTLTLCQSPMHYSEEAGTCVGSLHITSTPPTNGSANGFTYPVKTDAPANIPLSYKLVDAPAGFAVDTQGRVSGDPSVISLGNAMTVGFTVQAARGPNDWARQTVNFDTCGADTPIWDPKQGSCVAGPIRFTSPPDAFSASAHQVYSYTPTVSDSHAHAVLSFELRGAPTGMTVDGTGKVRWDTSGYEGQSVQFAVVALDDQGGWAIQPVSLGVCPGEQPLYDPAQTSCVAGPIQITSTPDSAASAKQVYHYQAVATHANALPIHFGLDAAPTGMSIDADGLVSWDSTGFDSQLVEFGVTASDSQGGWTRQTVYLTVCPLDTPTWDPNQGLCVSP